MIQIAGNLFAQQPVQANNKEIIKTAHCWS